MGCRLVRSHTDHELSDLDAGWWPSGRANGLGPVACNASPVPSQQRVEGDEPAIAGRPWECLGDHAK